MITILLIYFSMKRIGGSVLVYSVLSLLNFPWLHTSYVRKVWKWSVVAKNVNYSFVLLILKIKVHDLMMSLLTINFNSLWFIFFFKLTNMSRLEYIIHVKILNWQITFWLKYFFLRKTFIIFTKWISYDFGLCKKIICFLYKMRKF